ncbi:MAG TPA: FAD-binding oxidoreductase [Gemmatimonadaceae bacterium]
MTVMPAERQDGARTIDPAALNALQGRLRGTILTPGSAGYDEARAVWNAMIDRRPAAVVRCLGVADVVESVKFAREQQLPLSIKGGGHNIAGLAVCDGGLMLDMSLMRGVWVDPANRVAHAQAGCLLGDIDRETQLHGLAAVLGFVSATGAAGLTLGGGFGYLTRRFGWTVDNVRSMEVVTAGGRIVTASEREHADLFWGLCGGGGNFGVVTRFDFALHPVGPEIVGGAIAWRLDEAPRVLALYHELVSDAPRELVCAAFIRPAPPAPWLPREVHGTPIVALLVCHTGALEAGEKVAARIKSVGTPVGDILQRRTYVSQQGLIDATQPKGRRYYWKSEYVPDMSRAMLDQALAHGREIPSPHSAVLMFPLEGALNERSPDHSAVGNRDAKGLFNVLASWERADDDAVNIEWARRAWTDLRRFSTGGTYINFLTADEGSERTRSAYGVNFDRLVAVKRAWDPENLFRVNRNIVPPG